MTDLHVPVSGIEPTARSTAATWRYLGERSAADLAYCARFATDSAPEPIATPGGVWAYPLPPT